MTKKYRVRERAPQSVHEALSSHPEFLRDLLFARGIEDSQKAELFLTPNFERDSHDPYLLPDMDEAVDRVRLAAHNKEKVAVWSDYDCDGIPGGVALAEFLRDIGCEVSHYIPHRHEEGYGLNNEGLQELAKGGVTLVITVDLGTTDHEQVAHARSLGMEVIITDHHLPTLAGLPPALAVLNPYREDSRYPFQHLCGGGVAWKLIQATLLKERFGLPEGREKWLLDLIGLSTLSDMVPLIDENRMLASYGLLVMRKARRPGIAALLSQLRINARTLSEDDVAFMITPRVNAASRMDNPHLAARLLATRDRDEGGELALSLQKLNDERKGAVAATVKEARGRLREMGETPPVIVMGSTKWRPGILGLVANTLMESEGVPVFLWGRHGHELLKGSCRSTGVNVVHVMEKVKDVLADFGGHDLSGGFSLSEERAHELSPRLIAAYKELQTEALVQEILLDKELSLAEVPHAARELVRLAPFGEGNRKPLFIFPNVSISSMRQFGKQKNHLEVSFTRENDKISGVSFFATEDSFQKPVSIGARADVVGHLEKDMRGAPRLRVVDIL